MYGERTISSDQWWKEFFCFHNMKRSNYYHFKCDKCGMPHDNPVWGGVSFRQTIWLILGRIERSSTHV